MTRAVRLFIIFLVAAAVAHIAAVVTAPYVLMNAAMKSISRDGARINVWNHAPRVTEASRRIVRPSPDLAYSSCVYYLSKGPLHVTAAAWDDYMSVSAFASNSDNFFVVNDGQAPAGVDIVLVTADQERPANAANVIVSPSAKGIILQRRLAPTPERFDAADAARRPDKCETLK